MKNKKEILPSAVFIIVFFFLCFTLSTPSSFVSGNAGLAEEDPVVFNQHYVEKSFEEYGAFNALEEIGMEVSSQSTSWEKNEAGNSEMDPTNTLSIFRFVFSRIPPFAVVYPTETYYYWEIPEYNLAGNLRFTSIEEGTLHFAHFNKETPRGYGSKSFTSSDGLNVLELVGNKYAVSYGDKSVIFQLATIHEDRPQKTKLLPEEEFVAKIRDESAVDLFLVFNTETNSFYYILDEEKPVTEELVEVAENLWKGQRTEFIYYQDADFDRKILVGVQWKNIADNSYFDGPFDQVPPRLEIRDRLYKAYPYTQYLRGLDPHGRFLDFEGTRVAISSYYSYWDVEQLQIERVNPCLEENNTSDKSALWSCLTYEDKKDFHKTIPNVFYEDGTCKAKCLLPQNE